MSQNTSVSNCFHYVITIAFSVITDRLIRVFMRFYPKSQQRPSVNDVGCRICVKYTQLLANHSSGRLLPIMSIMRQTQFSDEGGQKQERK